MRWRHRAGPDSGRDRQLLPPAAQNLPVQTAFWSLLMGSWFGRKDGTGFALGFAVVRISAAVCVQFQATFGVDDRC